MFKTLTRKVHELLNKVADCPSCGRVDVAREATFCPYCISELL